MRLLSDESNHFAVEHVMYLSTESLLGVLGIHLFADPHEGEHWKQQ